MISLRSFRPSQLSARNFLPEINEPGAGYRPRLFAVKYRFNLWPIQYDQANHTCQEEQGIHLKKLRWIPWAFGPEC